MVILLCLEKQVITHGNSDDANEMNDYEYSHYAPLDNILIVKESGNTMNEPCHRQPLS
jgi:hypothetical protein